MIRISCSVKVHAFYLAEQLDKRAMLDKFYTIYHSGKNPIVAAFNKRKDPEHIRLHKIKTFPYLAALVKFRKDPFANNALFDGLVSNQLKRDKDYKALIGWSGMSLKAMRQAKQDGKKVILERGSSHIRFQFALLREEYKRWGYQFKGDERVSEQEEIEYELADHVVIPSGFVERTFLAEGISPKKLFKNNFGSNAYFSPTRPRREKFTILYVGNLSIRKGLPYLFEALTQLAIDPSQFDVWFVGSVSAEIRQLIPKFQKSNWKFLGHINHFDLADMISQCHVAVHPSLEEGMSMVIPQLMSCGVPVIATTNTGGEDIIVEGVNGYIVSIRSPQSIASRIDTLFYNRTLLDSMHLQAIAYAKQFGSWDQYGERYATFLNQIIH